MPQIAHCRNGHVVAVVWAHGIEIRDSKRQFTCTGQVTILCLRRVDGHPCGDQVRLLHAPLDKQRQAVLAIA